MLNHRVVKICNFVAERVRVVTWFWRSIEQVPGRTERRPTQPQKPAGPAGRWPSWGSGQDNRFPWTDADWYSTGTEWNLPEQVYWWIQNMAFHIVSNHNFIEIGLYFWVYLIHVVLWVVAQCIFTSMFVPCVCWAFVWFVQICSLLAVFRCSTDAYIRGPSKLCPGVLPDLRKSRLLPQPRRFKLPWVVGWSLGWSAGPLVCLLAGQFVTWLLGWSGA